MTGIELKALITSCGVTVAALSRELGIDLDVSGGKMKGRARFLALLERVQTGTVSVVSAYDQSRAFRNTQDALSFYALMEKRPDIEVAFVHGRFDRTPAGEFTYTAMAAAHSMERRMTGEKIKAAYHHLNAKGAATGMPPYGYRRVGDTLEIEDREAIIVRRLFEDYATAQWSARALAGRLNDEGVAKVGSRSRGLGWVPDTVVDVLHNVAYIGKTYSISRARREGELIPAAWEPIIGQALFERVQAVLEANRPGPGGAPKHEYTFSRLLVCSTCGRAMRSLTNYGHTYYYCRRDVSVQCPGASKGHQRGSAAPVGWVPVREARRA